MSENPVLPTPVGPTSGAVLRPASPPGTEPWFQRVIFFALLSGLCPLIPVPFLDDRTLDWVRRRMIYEQLRAAGAAPAPAPVRTLAGSDEGRLLDGCWSGCLVMPVLKIVVYLVRKVFSKIVVLLTLNQCVERFSETFHLGYLIHHGLSRGLLDPAAAKGSDASPGVVRRAIRDTLGEIDPRPVRQLVSRSLRGSRWLLLGASRALGRFVRRRPAADPAAAEPGVEARGSGAVGEAEIERELVRDESLLARLLERLSGALGAETGYLTALETVFERAFLSRAGAQPAVPPAADGPRVS